MLKTVNRIGQKCAHFFGLETLADKAFSKEDKSPEEKNFFQSVLCYRTFDSENELFENANSTGFCLEVSPLLGLYEFFMQDFSTFISEIGDEKDSIQCLLWADHRIDPLLEKWAEPRLKLGGMHQKIAEKKLEFFRKTLRKRKECPPARNFRFFFSYSSPRVEDTPTLKRKKEKALSFFSRISLAKVLNPQEFINTFSGLVNYTEETVAYARPYNPWNYIANGLCLPGSVEEKQDSLIFQSGQKSSLFKAFEVTEYPNQWSPFSTHNLLGDFLDRTQGIFGDFFIHYGIFFPSQEQTATRLQFKSKGLERQLRFKRFKTLFSSAEREYEETQFARKEFLEGKKFVQTRMSIGLFSDADHLLEAEDRAKKLFAQKELKITPCDLLHAEEFVRCLPMTWGESSNQNEIRLFRSLKTSTASEASLFVPLAAEWRGNATDGMPFLGRRGQFATWDLFKTQGNLNAVVIGASGEGKSVFMEDVITNNLGQKSRVFVLDLGRSFENLLEPYGGQHLSFSEGSNLKLNPFSLIPEGADSETTDAAISMVTSILATMAMPKEKIDSDRENMLGIAVKKARQKENASVDTVITILQQSDYKTERMRGKRESLIDALEKYTTRGEYRNFFYGDKEISFKSDFVIIETEELKNKGDLQAVILQIFTLMISTEVFMGDREKRSLICIDEGWDMLKSPQMGGFIESMARRLRKYNGSLMVGTQNLDDFKDSAGAAAFQNSNWLILIGASKGLIPYLKEMNLLDVTPHVESCLSSLRKVDGEYSEAFIYNKSSRSYRVVQLKLDPFSACLYSTKAEIFKAIRKLKKEGIKTEDAVEKLVLEEAEV